jgi:hypothetical protein
VRLVEIRFPRARHRPALGGTAVVTAAIGGTRTPLNSKISRSARIGGSLRNEFRERIFLTDQARELGERIFSPPNPRRRCRGRLRLWLPNGPWGPETTLFAHS